MPKSLPLPDQAFLHEILTYDPMTGKLFWNARSAASFISTAKKSPEQLANVWNGKLAGKSTINGQACLAHRVIFKWVHGYEPNIIDHDDQDGSNNRLSNLKDRDQKANMQNRRLSSNNPSGYHGVTFIPSRKKWESAIYSNGKKVFLGYFLDKQAAVDVRKQAEQSLSYNSNHGSIP
jgi:hypothetical protein